MAPQKLLPRHSPWRRTNRGGPALPTWQHVLRHCRTFLSRATVNGAAKKGYSSEIFSSMVYFLRLFQI
jgi:hypothetical protein